MSTHENYPEKIFRLAFELIPFIERDSVIQESVANLLDDLVLTASKSVYGPRGLGTCKIVDFGEITFPNYQMGAVDSWMHFELREIAVFTIYRFNGSKYDFGLDLGANLGLHSIMLSRIGVPEIVAVEPDPIHVVELQNRLSLNQITNVSIRVNAVSDFEGQASFTRVVGNTTSSHLSGLKPNAYGKLESFNVTVVNINNLLPEKGFVICKMDIEGSETDVLEAIDTEKWSKLDVIVEVTSPEAAQSIFNFLSKNPRIIGYSQKISWKKVTQVGHVPFNYREGSLFITSDPDWIFPGHMIV
jgi:FkbM family methyltransferase